MNTEHNGHDGQKGLSQSAAKQFKQLGVFKKQWRRLTLAHALVWGLAGVVPAVHAASMCSPTASSISGVVNTYYPGVGNPVAGDTSLTIGARNTYGSTTAVAAGDTVLVMQMQNATINAVNSNLYGDGTGDRNGTTSVGNSGLYEYKKVASVSGSTVTFTTGLTNNYYTGAQSTYQVVVVPQYNNVAISSVVTSAPWDGSSGGVVVLDANSAAFSGTGQINVTGQGFRGGFLQSKGCTSGIAGKNLDSIMVAPAETTSCTTLGASSGYKGEGIAGTPSKVNDLITTNPTTYPYNLKSPWATTRTGILTGRTYPGANAGLGAPGNAGGGGSREDSAGGGGGNAGVGNNGGYYTGWITPGGAGGQGYASILSQSRMFMGGGGGGGSNQQGATTYYTRPGSPGGGIILMRVGTLTGGQFLADGAGGSGNSGDGNGGSGAGGSIYVSAKQVSGTPALYARGGYTFADDWGNVMQGGAGGGGLLITNFAATTSVAKGLQLKPAPLTTAGNANQGVQQVVEDGKVITATAPEPVSVCGASVTLSKISNGGVGTFNFSGDNGFGADSITTTVAGTAATGVTKSLTAAGTVTTITETIPSGYALSGVSCTGLGTGGTATPNLSAGTVTLDAAATAIGANIACTFTNSTVPYPTVTIKKISTGGVGTFNFTGDNGFGSDAVTTTAVGAAATGVTKTLSLSGVATTITEAASDFGMTGASCTGMGAGGTATVDTTAGTVLLNAAATAAGSNIVCTFTNAKANALPNIILAKSGPSTAVVGNVLPYLIRLGNDGAAASGTTLTVLDQLPAGIKAYSAVASTNVSSVTCAPLNVEGALLNCTVKLKAAMPVGATLGWARFTINTRASAAGTLTNYASVDPLGGSAAPIPGTSCAPASSCGNASTVISAKTGSAYW